MKNIYFLLINLFIAGFAFSQQILFKPGDNIIEYLDQNPPGYLTYGNFLINSPDGRVDFLKYNAETSDTDTKYLVQGSTVFGVMQYQNDSTVILYDITGNGILDVGFNSLFIPFWVLSESESTKISGDNNLLRYLNLGYDLFNSNENPYSSGRINEYVREFAQNIDITDDNRDLFYGMLEYYSFSQYPGLALMLISELGLRYEKRFGTIHPLILLHTAESLINLGYGEYALKFINDIQLVDQNFIPAKVYGWQLETDKSLKDKKYRELITNYPNHWIVKQII